MTTETTTAARGDLIQLTESEIDAVGGALGGAGGICAPGFVGQVLWWLAGAIK